MAPENSKIRHGRRNRLLMVAGAGALAGATLFATQKNRPPATNDIADGAMVRREGKKQPKLIQIEVQHGINNTVPPNATPITQPIDITKENIRSLLAQPTHVIAQQVYNSLDTPSLDNLKETYGIEESQATALLIGIEISNRHYFESEADFTSFSEALNMNLRANPNEPFSPIFLAATGMTRQEIKDYILTAIAAWPDSPLIPILKEYLKN